MTLSASPEDADGERLARNLELYRDLSLVLQAQVAAMRAGAATAEDAVDAAKSHRKALQTVLELEASLVTRSRNRTGGEPMLDLDAARAEILGRLAPRAEGGGA